MLRAQIAVLFLFVFSGPLRAVEGLALLDRMSDAMRSSNYTGTFVYRHGDNVETLKIVHRQTENGVDERLITLTGKPSEIIRDDGKVTCIWPDKKLVLLDKNRRKSRFPGIVPENLDRLANHYTIDLSGRNERIAGRPSYIINIIPKDEYRYGYRLWIDRDAHLLLRSDLLDERDRSVEQVMFTELKVFRSLPDDLFKSEYLEKGYQWKEVSKVEQSDPEPNSNWYAVSLPPGFFLQTYKQRTKSAPESLVEHLVYSDGMASVSVFIEAIKKNDKQNNKSASARRGAVSIYRKPIAGHHITVLGDVPELTVKLIAESIQPK